MSYDRPSRVLYAFMHEFLGCCIRLRRSPLGVQDERDVKEYAKQLPQESKFMHETLQCLQIDTNRTHYARYMIILYSRSVQISTLLKLINPKLVIIPPYMAIHLSE